MRRFVLALSSGILAMSTSVTLAAGKIVVNHDDWTLSNTGFTTGGGINDPGVFAVNVANYFTGGQPGAFLAYSSSFGLTQSMLAAAMTGAGHSWTVSMAQPFTVATLSNYDGVFVGGNSNLSSQVLIDYVISGGNVYIFGGAGGGFEPTTFNPFLNTFGLSFGSPYNGLSGSFALSSSHPLFAGVDHLYHASGSTITDTTPGDPRSQIIMMAGGLGIYAVYDDLICGPPDGDMNGDGVTHGRDVHAMAFACMVGSTTHADLCHGDFSGNALVDAADVSGFVARLLQ